VWDFYLDHLGRTLSIFLEKVFFLEVKLVSINLTTRRSVLPIRDSLWRGLEKSILVLLNPDGFWLCPREFHPCSVKTAPSIACGGSTLGLWL